MKFLIDAQLPPALCGWLRIPRRMASIKYRVPGNWKCHQCRSGSLAGAALGAHRNAAELGGAVHRGEVKGLSHAAPAPVVRTGARRGGWLELSIVSPECPGLLLKRRSRSNIYLNGSVSTSERSSAAPSWISKILIYFLHYPCIFCSQITFYVLKQNSCSLLNGASCKPV